MKSLYLSVALALVAVGISDREAAAQYPAPYAGGQLGFFNPYTFPSSSSVRTPPYFAVHPPVYYSTRHARPYGMSPFAAPPMVSPASNYQGRQAADFVPKTLPNPYCIQSPMFGSDATPAAGLSPSDFVSGEIQINPFSDDARMAAR